MFNLILTFLAIFSIYLWITRKTPQPIAGIYRQPGKWYYIKYLFMFASITLKKWKSNMSTHNNKFKIVDPKCPKNLEMECIKPLPHSAPKAVDAVYFIGASKDGFYLTASMARRPNCIMDSIWLLRIPKLGLLKGLHHPDTTLIADCDLKYSAGGLDIEMIEPMKKWSIKFKGQMRLENEGTLLDVTLNAEYASCVPVFHCDWDIPTKALARAIAREPWEAKYFERLQGVHQNHYEQVGIIKGEVDVEGFGNYEFHLSGLRDHTTDFLLRAANHPVYVPAPHRDWRYMHRYGHHFITLENGLRMLVGIISQPLTFSFFEFGFVYESTGKIHGVEWCDLPLHYHGESGQAPLDYSFCFQAGGKKYWVQCSVIESPEVFIGSEWEARVLERMCTYTVNGVRGWGFAEWEYRHHGGRAEEHQQVLMKAKVAS